MPKALTISGMVVAVLFLLIFGLDLLLEFPFGRASYWMDVTFLLCAGMLGYMSWSTYREQV
jgi:predicted Abi (CAAX) family protease